METSIVSADYLLTCFLTICVVVAGIFAPASFEKSTTDWSSERQHRLHRRIFAWCVTPSAFVLLFGAMGAFSTLTMVVAFEVLMFGAMYFIGVLANESDKRRVREQEEARIRRARQEEENRRLQAQREAEARRAEELRRYVALCQQVWERYQANLLAFVLGNAPRDAEGRAIGPCGGDMQFMHEVEQLPGHGLGLAMALRFRMRTLAELNLAQAGTEPVPYTFNADVAYLVESYVERHLAQPLAEAEAPAREAEQRPCCEDAEQARPCCEESSCEPMWCADDLPWWPLKTMVIIAPLFGGDDDDC